ncbi:hypothetical protein D3C72_2328850 [compost metagenome]
MRQHVREGLGKLAPRHGRALPDFDRGGVVAQAEHHDVHRVLELLKPIGRLGATHLRKNRLNDNYNRPDAGPCNRGGTIR